MDLILQPARANAWLHVLRHNVLDSSCEMWRVIIGRQIVTKWKFLPCGKTEWKHITTLS